MCYVVTKKKKYIYIFFFMYYFAFCIILFYAIQWFVAIITIYGSY